MIEPWIYVVLFGIAAIFGLRGSVRLTQRYRDVRNQLDRREALILMAIVAVSWVITLAAVFYGVIAVRRLLGYDYITELVPVSAFLSIGILFIPTFLDAVVDRVARVPWK